MTTSYRIAWLLSRFLFTVYFRYRVYNPERVPLRGGVVLASNHASYADPFLIGAGVRRPLNYLARETLFRFPVFGRLLKSWNAVPVDRDGAGATGLKNILSRLLEGGAVVLFPEGTRTSDGKWQKVRSGVGLTVIKSNAPVIPVRLFGTFEAYGRHRNVPLPRTVTVKYGEVLDFSKARAEAALCSKARLKQIYQEIADQIMDAIRDLEPCREKARFP